MIRVVVVTDRKRYASEETARSGFAGPRSAAEGRRGELIAGRIAALLAHAPRGAVAIQVREKDLDGGPLLRLVREVIEVARPLGAPVLVNDRVDVALAAGADGVHLPERGLAVADARALAPRGWLVGCSRHAPGRVDGADLVQLGPIWDTPGKGPTLGPGVLATSVAPAQLIAVGGIDRAERARAAAAAGADAVAVIRAAWLGPAELVGQLVAAVEAGCADRTRP